MSAKSRAVRYRIDGQHFAGLNARARFLELGFVRGLPSKPGFDVTPPPAMSRR
jgi:hypothetical protein